MVLIYADFMKSDDQNRLVLTCFGTKRDLEKYGITLEDGLTLVFYNEDEDDYGNRDDLVVRGIVEFDNKAHRWAARINWDDVKNISQLSAVERQGMGVD
jgi:uncharacterized protein (UPF0210 family)